MSSLTTKFQEIVGGQSPQGGRWAKVLVEIPADPALKKLRGDLFAVWDVTSPEGVDLPFLFRLVITALQETYYTHLDGTPLSALEKALYEVRRKVEGFVAENAAAFSGTEIDFNLTAASLWGKVLYVSQLGEGVAYLLRQGKIQRVGHPAGSQVTTTSGIVEPEDLLILGSAYFGETVTAPEIAADVGSLSAKATAVDAPAAWAVLLINVKPTGFLGKDDFVRFSRPQTESETKTRGGLLRWPRRRPPVVPSAAGRGRSRSRRWLLLFLVLGSVLAASVLLTRRQRQESAQEQTTAEVLGAAAEAITEAESLYGLNDQRAREILAAAADQVKEALTKFPENDEFKARLEQIEKLLATVDHQETVTGEIYYQLPEGSRPVSLQVAGDRLLVADAGRRCWVEITAGSEAECRFADDNLNLRAVFTVDAVDYALADDGYYQASDSASLRASEIEGFDNFGAVTDVKMYLTNLYLLLSGRNEIVKVTPTAAGRVALDWLEEESDLSGEQALAVDGHIYTVGDRGIRRFYLGAEEEFTLKGWEETLTEPVDIATAAGFDHLYVLDAGSGRVVVFDKEGSYAAQYRYRTGLAAQRLAVDAEETTVYLLTDEAVWRFAL